VLVGINRYDSGNIASLHCAVNDAREVGRALIEAVGVPPDHVALLTSEDLDPASRPTVPNIIHRLEQWIPQVHPDDAFFFLFSGHGMVSEGEGYLLTVEADPRSLETVKQTCLKVADLQRLLNRMPAGKVLVCVDACRDSPVSEGRGVREQDNLLSEELARGFVVNPKPGTGEVEATATFFACKVGQRSYEWEQQGLGFFSFYLVRGLRGSAADEKGQVTLNSLEQFLSERVPPAVRREKNREQVPWVQRAGAGVGRWILSQPRAGGHPAPPDSRTAQLLVRSNPPGAQVYLDGELCGTTGETPLSVPVDTAGQPMRALFCRLQLGSLEAETWVTVMQGLTQHLELTLQPGPGSQATPVGVVLVTHANKVVIDLRPGTTLQPKEELQIQRVEGGVRRPLARIQVDKVEGRWGEAHFLSKPSGPIEGGDEVWRATASASPSIQIQQVGNDLDVTGASREEVFEAARVVLQEWRPGKIREDRSTGKLKAIFKQRIGDDLIENITESLKRSEVYLEVQMNSLEDGRIRLSVDVYYRPWLSIIMGKERRNAQTREKQRSFLEAVAQRLKSLRSIP